MVSFLAVSTSMTLNELVLTILGFDNFFTILVCDTHFKSELR